MSGSKREVGGEECLVVRRKCVGRMSGGKGEVGGEECLVIKGK